MNNFKSNLEVEISELKNKVNDLSVFIEKPNFDDIVKVALQRKLLVIQLSQMNSLLNVLKVRLDTLE